MQTAGPVTATAPSVSGAAAKPAYPPPAAVPTRQGPHELRFDFNEGCRVALPQSRHPWRVRISDLDTGNILYETELQAGRVASTKRYFVRFRIDVWQQGESVFHHEYSAAGQPVLIQFPIGTLGDTLGWFPYAVKFREKHDCRLTCAMAERLIPLFRDTHPEIEFVTHEEVQAERFYATYSLGLFFDDKDGIFQPSDFRHVGLHRTAAYILGVDPTETPPRIALPDEPRPVAEPYVCIAVQSTTQSKCGITRSAGTRSCGS
jgi:autotransporter strand-loop-strand O-heptosyltransferase